MHVIWKRPDGFHGSDPSDYMVVQLGNQSKFWLHKRDHAWYPFQVAGGWQESEATQRLNLLVNLLSQNDQAWTDTLVKLFDDSMGDDPKRFLSDIVRWVSDLKHHLKGDTWEIDLMSQVMTEVIARVEAATAQVLERAKD